MRCENGRLTSDLAHGARVEGPAWPQGKKTFKNRTTGRRSKSLCVPGSVSNKTTFAKSRQL